MNNLKHHQIKKVQNKKETVTSLIGPVQALEVFDPETDSLVASTSDELKKSFYKHVISPEESETGWNVVYQVVFPDDLNLKPPTVFQKSRGRPKKPKIQVETTSASQKTKIKVVSKTRSGRAVKFPKYIENEFKKIEINDDLPPDSTDADVKILDFVKYSEVGEKKKADTIQSKLIEQPDLQQKKRKISAHYRCPKCKKAYLGRNKILEHLKKNPSHGPMQQNEEKNFEVWNYLVSVTQKCPSSERGQKFCQELSNLLHNLLLLTSALFKKIGSAANEVKVDQVLGNAIGLTPGNYYFDDNSLYKNVTVLKLMANNDFLHSIRSKTDDTLKTAVASTNCNCGKRTNIDESVLKSMLISPKANNTLEKQANGNKPLTHTLLDNNTSDDSKNISQNVDNGVKLTGNVFLAESDVNSQPTFLTGNEYQVKPNLLNNLSTINVASSDKNWQQQNTGTKTINLDCNEKESIQAQHLAKNNDEASDGEHNTFSEDVFFSSDINLVNNFPENDYEMKQPDNNQANVSHNLNTVTKELKYSPSSPKINTQSNILKICPPKLFQKNVNSSKPSTDQNIHNKNLINPELMTDNSVLVSPMSNLRQSDDELMLPAPSETSNILDTSSSSDEVMNVDQFVNERFRKITESDLESNSTTLNLELPSLDLFQFHPS